MTSLPWKRPLAVLVASLLAACGTDAPAPDAQQGPAADHTTQPPAAAVTDTPPPPAAPLPPTRALEVRVEGRTELREATLFQSPQGYAIYVLPQLVMTQEEPCCDLAWARADDGFFMRIERIDPDQDLAVLRDNIVLGLSSVGEAEALPPEQAGADWLTGSELFLRARSDDVTSYMLVARIDGGRYRITLHLPHREALEGIAPSMWAMLASIRTTGPRRRP